MYLKGTLVGLLIKVCTFLSHRLQSLIVKPRADVGKQSTHTIMEVTKGTLGSIFAGSVRLASQNPFPIKV